MGKILGKINCIQAFGIYIYIRKPIISLVCLVLIPPFAIQEEKLPILLC